MIDTQQKTLESSSLNGLIDFTGDGPQLQVRRLIESLVAAETAT